MRTEKPKMEISSLTISMLAETIANIQAVIRDLRAL
jgi:hypothetical protein